MSFNGSKIYGQGFVISEEAVEKLVGEDRRYEEVLSPYLTGKDLNSKPDQAPSNWVINFYDWDLDRAEQYKGCMSIVRREVKPERDKNSRKARREKWWQFGEISRGLYERIEAIRGTDSAPEPNQGCVAAISSISAHLAFTLITTPRVVFSHNLTVLALDRVAHFTLVSSNIHLCWAFFYSSTLESRAGYRPSDCFETFPFPPTLTDLDKIGLNYSECRKRAMLEHQCGLTQVYNFFHDPAEKGEAIDELRRIQRQMDEQVALAYGWSDIDLGHNYYETKQGFRYTISDFARLEVLDRLLALNHERYAEEVAQGFHDKNKSKKRKAKKKSKPGSKKKQPVGQGELFSL